jgi:hypothetical protein
VKECENDKFARAGDDKCARVARMTSVKDSRNDKNARNE